MLANRTRQPRIIGLFSVIVALFALTAQPAHAAMFEVRDVAVDATASSAAQARDQALLNGQREAFYRLLRRLTLKQYRDILPNLDAETVSTYVRDFSVSGEKTSNVRYLARLNVRFKENDIRTLLEEFGIPFSETASRPAVVLPLLNRGGTATLWSEPNPWRSAWSSTELPSLPVPLMLPVGDIEDVAVLSTEQALGADPGALEVMARRYAAGAAIVARAEIAVIGPPHVELTITRFDIGIGAETLTTRVNATFGETVDVVLRRAVDVAIETIEENWKSETLMRFDQGGILAVNVPLATLEHWLSIRSRLADIAVIERTDLILISRDEALLNIHYIGAIDQLSRTLAQANLTLRETEGAWSLLTPETARRAATVN